MMLAKDSVAGPAGGEAASATPSSATCCCRPTTSSICTAARLRAADRRQRPVGQHHRRHRPRSAAWTARTVHALTTPLLTKADGTKFGKTERRRALARPGADAPVRVLPVLAQRRRPRTSASTSHAHLPAARGDRGARGGRPRSGRAARDGPARLAPRSSRRSCTAPRRRTPSRRPAQALFGRANCATLDERHAGRARCAELPSVPTWTRAPTPSIVDLLAGHGLVAEPRRQRAGAAVARAGPT